MPFRNHEQKPNKTFSEIDRLIIQRVFPTLKFNNYGSGSVTKIYPNSRITSISKGGTTDPAEYLVLQSLKEGLNLEEIGFWLDSCLDVQQIRNSDGVTRRFRPSNDPMTWFDRRKLIYYYQGIPQGSLIVYPQ